MHRNWRDKPAEDADGSPATETWLFAQDLLGNHVSGTSLELLEWLAHISPSHADELRRRQSAEAEARRQREELEWLATISTEWESKLRAILREEAEKEHAQTHLWPGSDDFALQEAEWDASKHPRGSFPQNRGWFSPTGGSSSAGSAPPTRVEPGASGQGPATKPQLPADQRGTWISGTKGDGVFRYYDSIENQQAGIAGKEVRFEKGYIAIGGFPPEAYYGGNSEVAGVEIASVTGFDADNLAADAAMRAKLGDPKWQRPKGYIWNHAGTPGSRSMELVDEELHGKIAHKGPAAEPRAARRIAGVRGATGRAMGALTVYVTARDALQAAGVLQPDYEVEERETYHYVAEDGSVFVVWPAGWFSSPMREFVAGPRKGQTEAITDAQVDEYRQQAEKEWGKYIPGTLFSEPRFIPGSKRKSLPLIQYRFGIPFEAGWIDEKGVHHYAMPKASIT